VRSSVDASAFDQGALNRGHALHGGCLQELDQGQDGRLRVTLDARHCSGHGPRPGDLLSTDFDAYWDYYLVRQDQLRRWTDVAWERGEVRVERQLKRLHSRWYLEAIKTGERGGSTIKLPEAGGREAFSREGQAHDRCDGGPGCAAAGVGVGDGKPGRGWIAAQRQGDRGQVRPA
jgi:hypothetical protein